MLKLCKIHACPDGTLGLHLSRAPWDPYPWVSGVQDNSNAQVAGVCCGDTILELNGCDVLGQRISELAVKIRNHWERGESFITFLIWRNKTESSAVNQQSLSKFAKCLQQIAQLLECPVCLEVVKPPGWQCCNGHVLCNSCRGRTVKCPICRVTLGPRGRCLLSDKLFTLLAESFPCDGVRSGNSSLDCPKDYNDTPALISAKIDSTPSPSLGKVHQRKQQSTGRLKKPDVDSNQVAANGDHLPDDNIVVLKLNPKAEKKNDFAKHGSCHHRHHHHHHQQQQKREQHHSHHAHTPTITTTTTHFHHSRRTVLGRQQRTFHCPTGKSSCYLLHNATTIATAEDDYDYDDDTDVPSNNNSRPDPNAKTLDGVWTQDVSRKVKGEEKIETLGKFITEWDVLSHLTQVHQISVVQHYTTFGQAVRLQFMNVKSMPCITIQSQRSWNRNKENFKNNFNGPGSVVGRRAEGRTPERSKNSWTTSTSKNVHRPNTELFFVACIPLDSTSHGSQEEEESWHGVNDVNADTPGYTPPPPRSCLQTEFDDHDGVVGDTAGTGRVFSGSLTGLGTGVIKTATESKPTNGGTFSRSSSHLIQDTGSSQVDLGRSPTGSTRSTCSRLGCKCTWTTSFSSSSSSSSSSASTSSLSCSSSLASFSMSSRCCSNTMTQQHAIFIWYFGGEHDVKNFQTVIECKRSGLKWTGCVHPLTESWPSIRNELQRPDQLLVVDSMPDGGDNFFDIVIKIK